MSAPGEGRSPSPVPFPRYVGLNVPSSLEGAYNRGWNACREAILTGRDEFDRCTFCAYSAGHANDCPVSAPARVLSSPAVLSPPARTVEE